LAGTGLIIQPTFIVSDDIRDGRLQIVLKDYEIEPMGVYAMYAHRQYLSGEVRTFVEFLAGYFGSPPYWECA
jgi:DNA-binding transcriptional LysR family regulator